MNYDLSICKCPLERELNFTVVYSYICIGFMFICCVCVCYPDDPVAVPEGRGARFPIQFERVLVFGAVNRIRVVVIVCVFVIFN